MAELVRASMVAYFLAHGYQPYQAQALIRSAWVETRLQPCVVSRSGHYLFQWNGSRLKRLIAYAGKPGCPPLETQLAFANYELRTEPAYRCFFTVPAPAAYATLRRTFEHGHRCTK